MLPYIALIFIPLVMIFVSPYRMHPAAAVPCFLFYVVFIGTRFDVGPDWWGYTQMSKTLIEKEYSDIILKAEPLFGVLFKFFYEWSPNLLLINLFSAVVYCTGVFLVSRRLPEPWIGVLAFTSLPIPLIAMSAVRQAIAAGLILILLAFWGRVSTLSKYIAISLAALFHFSALINVAFVITADRLGFYKKILFTVLGIIFLIYIVRSDQFTLYKQRYTAAGADIEASGALSHVSVDFIPAAFYLALRGRWRPHFAADRLFTTFCVLSLLLVPLVPISSVSASRLSFYFSIVPAVVWSTTPIVFARTELVRTLIRIALVCVLGGLYVFWLNYANVAWLYFPYQSFWLDHIQIHPL